MTVLITGVAGFIGMSCAAAVLERGDEVLGIDNLNRLLRSRTQKEPAGPAGGIQPVPV